MPQEMKETANELTQRANEVEQNEKVQKEENILITNERNFFSLEEPILLDSNKLETSEIKLKEENPTFPNLESEKQKDKNLIKQDISNDDEAINITPTKEKTVKKVNKRYQELLENSLLVFDRPKKNKFSVIKSNNQESGSLYPELGGVEAKLVKDLNLNSKELEFNLNYLNQNKKKIKEVKHKQPPKPKQLPPAEKRVKTKFGVNPKKCNSEKQVLEELNQILPKIFSVNNTLPKPKILNIELVKIYRDINQIKMLGKKRNNYSNLDLYFISDSPFKQQIKNNPILNHDIKSSSKVTKNNLKNNFLNPGFEDLLKTNLNILNHRQKKTENEQNENTYWSDSNIINQFDMSLRREFASTLDFQKKFNEDYAPIQMQKENEKIFQNESLTETSSVTNEQSGSNKSQIFESISKTHFIKKKQSAVNIKRQCGVSYVVASESKQKEVSDKYDRLGHLVYQGTYSVSQSSDFEVNEFINHLIESELMHRPLLVSYFESPDEDEMKEYLLFPQKRLSIAKEVYLIESLDEVWKFAKDKFFLCVHLLLDSQIGIRNFTKEEIEKDRSNLVSFSDVQIGFLFRKATSGVKSVLKLYKNGGLDNIKHPSTFKLSNLDVTENVDNIIEKLSGSNMSTLSMRIELYVKEQTWKSADYFTQQFLYSFMCSVEEKITKLILNWNEYRNQMHILSKEGKGLEYIGNHSPIYSLKKGLFNNELLNKENNSEKDIYRLQVEKLLNNLNFTLNLNNGMSSQLELSNLFTNKLLTKLNRNDHPSSLIYNISYSSSPLPMYIISTRDCFVFDLSVTTEILNFNNRQIVKKEYFFNENNAPNNFHKFKTNKNDLRVGIVTYEDFFTNEELSTIEKDIEQTEDYSLKDAFLPETAQKTFAGEKLKRTKFFFGSRYMWTKKQLAEPNSYVAAGIRKDVSPPPYWMKEKIEEPLVKAGIIEENFINSFALNIYHDGSEGLGQHFDDAVRFKQPIFTLRLFSDCRLSFGSQLYGFCNGAFTIPLPRGCVCVMEENSYASNGVKHCIRPCDMTGKSSALILRQMHPTMVNEADRYDYLVDFPSWFSALSINDNSVPYYLQKTKESEFLIKLSEMEKKSLLSRTNPAINEEVVSSMNDILTTLDLYNESKNTFQEPLSKKGRKKIEY